MKKKLKLIIIFSILIIVIPFICFVPLIWEGYCGSEGPFTYDENEFGKITPPEEVWDDYENDCYDCRLTFEGSHKAGIMKFDINYFADEKEHHITTIDVEITNHYKKVINIPHISDKKGMVHLFREYTIDRNNSIKYKMEKRYTILQYIIKEIKYRIEYIKDIINEEKNRK